MASRISHIVVDSVLYDIHTLNADTQAQFLEMVPSNGMERLLKHPVYGKEVKKVGPIKI